MGKLKNILFMDVDNPNEKADGPIALLHQRHCYDDISGGDIRSAGYGASCLMDGRESVICVNIWISDRNDLSQSYKNSTYMVQCGYSCGCLF